MIKRIGVGIIGCGFVSNYHARAYLANPKTKLIAVADVKEDVAKEASQKYGAEAYSDYRELLKRDDVEAVSICTPHQYHAEIAIAAAEDRKHILCEKPLAMSLEECDKMIGTCKKAGIKLMEAFVSRFAPSFRETKDLIDDGAIGNVVMVRSTRAGFFPEKEWYRDPKRGGILFDRLCWGIERVRWFTNSEIAKVYAEADAIVYEDQRRKYGPEFIDTVKTIIKMRNKAIASTEDTYVGKFGYYEKDEILGSEGLIIHDPFRHNLITLYSNKEGKTPFLFDGLVYPKGWSWPDLSWMPWAKKVTGAFVEQIKHFADCIIEDKQPLVTGEDGRSVVEGVLAAKESIKSGRAIRLPLKG